MAAMRDNRWSHGVHSPSVVAMVKVTLDNPASVAAPFANRFANVARVDIPGGVLLTLAGQVAVDDDGVVMAPGDTRAQAERIFEIIGGLLGAHGAGFTDVTHIRTFMLDLGDLPPYAEIRRKVFPSDPPPSTTVQVSGLFMPGLTLEVEVTAAVALR